MFSFRVTVLDFNTVYHILLTILLLCRWVYVMFLTVNTMLTWTSMDDLYTSKNIYATTKYAIKLLLLSAFLEFFHALFKLVRSNPMIVFIQCFARFVVIIGVTDIFVEVKRLFKIMKIQTLLLFFKI